MYLLGGFLGATRFNDVWKSSDCGTIVTHISYQTVIVKIVCRDLRLLLESCNSEAFSQADVIR